MAVLLFVHGVATRESKDYDAAVKARGRRFREVAFAGAQLSVRDTYWGSFGANPRWQLACIPVMRTEYQDLGVGGDVALAFDHDAAGSDKVVAAGRADLAATVAALSVEDLTVLEAEGDEDALRRAERFWAAAAAYADRLPHPGWLDDVVSDEEFGAHLREQVEPLVGEQDLGLLDPIANAVQRISGAISNWVNAPIARIGREGLSPSVAIFVGDVFRYLREAEPRASIRQVVIADLVSAAKDAQRTSAPLVVVGHSMGGIILYDLLSDAAVMAELDGQLEQPLKVDLLLTIGSQVGLFEELKLFTSSSDERFHSADPPLNRVPRPARTERWWNVFDRMDVLSFLAEPVFDGVTDFEADTIAGVRGAHGAYFTNMVFYERLNRRLRDAGLLA